MSICDKCGRESECPVAHEDDFCLNYVRKPQTNADRIRAITDEELARMLMAIHWDESDVFDDVEILPSNYSDWLDWLKQESEGE